MLSIIHLAFNSLAYPNATIYKLMNTDQYPYTK